MWNEIFSAHSWRLTIQVCGYMTCMSKAIITHDESRRPLPALLYIDVVLQRRKLYLVIFDNFQLNKF